LLGLKKNFIETKHSNQLIFNLYILLAVLDFVFVFPALSKKCGKRSMCDCFDHNRQWTIQPDTLETRGLLSGSDTKDGEHNN